MIAIAVEKNVGGCVGKKWLEKFVRSEEEIPALIEQYDQYDPDLTHEPEFGSSEYFRGLACLNKDKAFEIEQRRVDFDRRRVAAAMGGAFDVVLGDGNASTTEGSIMSELARKLRDDEAYFKALE